MNYTRQWFKAYKEETRKIAPPLFPEAEENLEIDVKLLKNYGIDEPGFNKVFEDIKRKWWDGSTSLRDCEAKRDIISDLFHDLENPLKLAIIADKLDVFKQFYHDKSRLFLSYVVYAGQKRLVNIFRRNIWPVHVCASLK